VRIILLAAYFSSSERSISALDQKLKEPRSLFFVVLFLFVHLIRNVFSQAQIAVLFDLPNQEDFDDW
jgi:hypothetical protein